MRKTKDKVKKAALKYLRTDWAYNLATLKYAPEMSGLIYEIKESLSNVSPQQVGRIRSGVYILRAEDEKPLAVFKTRHHIQEYAAYRLDHEHFANVPPTVIAALDHPLFGGLRIGALQLFVAEGKTMIEKQAELYNQFEDAVIHKIAQLDLRLLNADRHSDNILIDEKNRLFPIDHEFVLPKNVSIAGLGWMSWKQAKNPFSEEMVSYLSRIDLGEDCKIIREELGLSDHIVKNYYIANIFLKCGAMRKMTPLALANFVKKKQFNDPKLTVFDVLLERLRNHDRLSWTIFTSQVYEEVERILEEHAPS